MSVRASFRAAQPLKRQIRTYATEPPARSSRTPLWIAAAMVPVAYIAYSYLGSGQKPQSVTDLAKKANGQEAPKTFIGGDQGFFPLTLKEVQPYNHNTKKFVFSLPSGDHVSGLNIASAILTRKQSEGEEKPTIKPYTPISDESEKGNMTLLVKKYPNGAMSTHLFDLNPGDKLDFKGPIPKYPWSSNKHSSIALIAGGTGITPMYQLVRAIFSNPEDNTKVTLVYGNISEDDILLKREFDELENTYPRRFKAFYTLDKPPENWQNGKGFITKDLLKTVLPEPKEENIKVFVCGPPPLYKAISGPKDGMKQGEAGGILKELGYSIEQIYKF